MKTHLVAMLAIAAFFTSYKKDKADDATEAQANVYVSGIQVTGGMNQGVVWKDGLAVNLADCLRNSIASGIAVKGNDVYACRAEVGTGNTNLFATVWKNGQRQTIGLQQSRATDITVN